MTTDMIGVPEDFDWRHWVDRFDRMQERYIPERDDRFKIIARTIRTAVGQPHRVLDLGCGTGSLSLAVLQAFPKCQLVGIDLDGSLLMLAKHRLAVFGQRAHLVNGDLRQDDWTSATGDGFDAVVSATALHWLSANNLASLYRRLASVLKSGGIFINADHVASECPAIQAAWQEDKARQLAAKGDSKADTWPAFWQAYATALNVDPTRIGSNVVGTWEGVEDGMPLAWHFVQLRESGFSSPDCFGRSYGDAIYGGIRS